MSNSSNPQKSNKHMGVQGGGGGRGKFGPNESNMPRSGPKLSFSPFSQVWDISFPLNCIGCYPGTMSSY